MFAAPLPAGLRVPKCTPGSSVASAATAETLPTVTPSNISSAFVPLLDFGANRGRPRRILNVLAAIWVAFFIVMTAWGIWEKPPKTDAPPAAAGKDISHRGDR